MSAPKRILVLIVTALFAVSTVIGQTPDYQSEDSQSTDAQPAESQSPDSQSEDSQEASSQDEMSIEESYLQEAIEIMIIRDGSRANSREQKMVALEYIGSALERGSTNEEIRIALDYLSLEGTLNQARESGRLVNNFPDVRRQAAKYLGTLGTREAKSTLIKMCGSENEPLVTQEAIKALGVIGMNDNNDAVTAVVSAAGRMHNIGIPDNLVALAAAEALDKLTTESSDVDPRALQLLTDISEGGAYATPVRERARQVLINMHRYAVRNRNQNNKTR